MVGGILEITEDINGSYEVVLAIAASATVVAVASFVPNLAATTVPRLSIVASMGSDDQTRVQTVRLHNANSENRQYI